MLQGISWNNYFAAVAILVTLWYLVIGLVFYRKELSSLVRSKTKLPFKKPQQIEDTEEEADLEPERSISSFDELEAIVNDIRHSILEVAGKEADKDALLQQLQTRLAYYDGLRQPAYRVALNNFLIEQAKEINGVSFSEEELDEAWEATPR